MSRKLRMTRRQALRLLAVGGAGTAAAAGHAFLIEPDWLEITRREVPLPFLPSTLDGLKVGILTDLHFRPGADDGLVSEAVAEVNRLKLDLLALTGDFITEDPSVVPPLLDHLRQATAAHGVFAVAGNHDGWHACLTKMARQFEKSGISFLSNRHAVVRIARNDLGIAGTDFVWLGKPDPEATFKGMKAEIPAIALVHEPDFFDTMKTVRPGLLQLSGHTHGGQCRVPIIGYAPARVDHGRRYLDGLYSDGPSRLFVSRGVGTSGPRVRFACRPQLAVLTLRSPEAAS